VVTRDPKLNVQARLVPVTSREHDRGYCMRLSVDDAASGMTIVDMELDAEHVMQLLRGSETGGADGIPAKVVTENTRRLLGKYRTTNRRLFNSAWYTEAQVDAWGKYAASVIGADATSITKTSGGDWRVTLVLWLTPDEIAAGNGESCQQVVSALAAPDRLSV
jgi:hypothetical protein